MASSSTAESAIRNYLVALRDPSSLRDDAGIAALEQQLEDASDDLERLRLRQQIYDTQAPSVESYEADFITHAKSWADEHGITAKAFEAEGISGAVLRKAGFAVGRGRGGAGGRGGRKATGQRTRSRVTVDEVRSAIPKGTFTIKRLQEVSGASPAVVRKVVTEEKEAGRLTERGADPDHRGPGRAPALFERSGK